jgi:hypothetical protein
MTSLERWFPVAFALPFLFATTQSEVAKLPSEIARWVMLAAACGLAVLHGMGRGPGKRIGMVPADFVALGFFAFFALSAVWAIDQSYSIQRTVSFGMLYVATFWYGWSYADRFGEEQLLQLLLRTATVILGANLLVYSALAPGEIIARRFQGFFDNPNNIGLICAISLPLVFSELLRKRGLWQWADFAVFFLSLLACGSRTGLVSSAVGMLLIGGLGAIRGNRIAIGFGIGLAVLVGLISLTNFFDENVVRTGSLETLSNRTQFWDLAKLDYIPKRPWLGHGFGTDGEIHEHYGIALVALKLRGYGVMSSYYGLAVAVGIPATVLFYLALASGLVRPLTKYRRDLRLMALCGLVIAGLLVGITESAIYSVGNCFAYLYWMGVALLVRRTVYRMKKIPMTRSGALQIGRARRARRLVRKAVGCGRASHWPGNCTSSLAGSHGAARPPSPTALKI